MTSQSAMIEDTVLAMKRVINKNKADAFSESDSEPPKPTNRGQKLKRKSQHFHEGQMGGYKTYKRKVEHAGYTRHILHRNPKRYDEEGYELFDDDTDEEADQEAAAKNPYNDVRIESLLMPLTQASDLNDHPSLSLPYKSQTLPVMVEEACDMMHKEKRTLADMKLLLAKFRGDPTWMPLGAMLGEDDSSLFGTYPQLDGSFAAISLEPTAESLIRVEQTSYERHSAEKERAPKIAVNGQTAADIDNPVIPAVETPIPKINGVQNGILDPPEEAKAEPVPQHAGRNQTGAHQKAGESTGIDGAILPEDQDAEKVQLVEGDIEMKAVEANAGEDSAPTIDKNMGTNAAEAVMADAPTAEPSKSSNPPTPSAISSAGQSPPRMLTRGRANARSTSNNDPTSPQPESIPHSPSLSDPPIHPLYIPPSNAMPSRDLGLPSPEAEDSRRILSAWVQKQEEVCRGAERLYEGLLKAQRMRNTVWRWCRAEGHVGELSDGEDWVDMEEWGLDVPLKKGDQDGAGEEETGKKTRGRRTAGG